MAPFYRTPRKKAAEIRRKAAYFFQPLDLPDAEVLELTERGIASVPCREHFYVAGQVLTALEIMPRLFLTKNF